MIKAIPHSSIRYPKYWNLSILGIKFERVHFTMRLKTCGWVPNSVDIIKGFVLGLHCLLSIIKNTPIQIYRKFHLQKLKTSDKKNTDVFIFLLKNRLWVLVRTASVVPTIYFSSFFFFFFYRNQENNVYPCKFHFYYIKVGFKGSILYRHFFVMGLSGPILKGAMVHLFIYFSGRKQVTADNL